MSLKNIELSNYEDQVGPICGGIVLEEHNTICIQPMCCADVGNIKEWERIFESEMHKWNQLWIGHPWIYYRRDSKIIEFSDYTESDPKDFKNSELLIRVSELELRSELKRIREQQNDFEFRIQKTLEKMGIADAERVSKLMTGSA